VGRVDVSVLAGRRKGEVAMAIPWWFKIGAKIVLSRIPLSYRMFAAIGIFRHGSMHDPDYAISVFSTHFDRSDFASKATSFVGLELGVGDSIASAIIARAHGASACYLVDSNRNAVQNIDIYQNVVTTLKERGLDVADIGDATNIDELLRNYGGVYLVDGLRSLKSISDASVDFVWSQAVLEHIRVHEFDETLAELYRILRPEGIVSHKVDLRDHLGGALNNRRISTETWEAEWMAQSGFYTNRISFRDMLRRFAETGFSVEILNVDKWEHLPTPKDKMAVEFSTIPDEELLVSGFDVMLRR